MTLSRSEGPKDLSPHDSVPGHPAGSGAAGMLVALAVNAGLHPRARSSQASPPCHRVSSISYADTLLIRTPSSGVIASQSPQLNYNCKDYFQMRSPS